MTAKTNLCGQVHLINFFTAGPDEVKAWTIRKGFKANLQRLFSLWLIMRHRYDTVYCPVCLRLDFEILNMIINYICI